MAYSRSYLEGLKRSYQNLKKQKQKRVTQLTDEMQRLKDAQRKLESIEDGAVKDLEKNTKKKRAAADLEWRGGTKDLFDAYIEQNVEKTAKDYRNSIDKMTDSIEWKIQMKKGERDLLNGDIISLTSKLNWVYAAIKNLVT